jgi:hypothetical protein
MTPPTSRIPDSGQRSNFQTGAVRDAAPGKGIPSEIPPCAITALAARFEEGALKYDRGNWRKGIPLSRYHDGLTRHALKAAQGFTDEDHFGAMLFNAAGWLWTWEQIQAGKLPAALNDLPYHPGNPANAPKLPPIEQHPAWKEIQARYFPKPGLIRRLLAKLTGRQGQ